MSKAQKPTYWELLRDPQWQKKRLEIMQRDGFRCKRCEDESTTLNVHHSYYERGLAPWEYPDESLDTFCEPCHEIVQEQMKHLHRCIGRMSHESIGVLIGMVKMMSIDAPWGLVSVESAEIARGMLR